MPTKRSFSLNPGQKEAVFAPNEPLLIVAGAGTGKTRTLTGRIARLIEEGVPPQKICALTFTNKAAREMAERVSALTGRPLGLQGGAFLGTFHSLGARILRAEGHFLGRTSSFAIFDDHDSLQLVKKLIKNSGDDKAAKPAAVLGIISNIKNGLADPAEIAVSRRASDARALELFTEYEQSLTEQNAFDFDDLIEKTVLVLTDHPHILARYRRRYEYLFVDEYQDINNVQYRLIRLLAGAHGRVSVVGDDHQTIYSWRGSNIEIFLNFKNDWPKSRVVLLEENYRSSANIINAAQAVIANNKHQTPKILRTTNPAGELVTLVEAGDEEEEASWVIGKIKNQKFPPKAGPPRAENIKNTTTTAILYRTNAQSRAIEEELLLHRIPYRIFGGLKFYERREVRDVLAALRVAANPRDEISRERLKKTFAKKTVARLVSLLAGAGATAPHRLIEQFIETAHYFEYLDKNFTNATERKENVAELIRFARTFTELTPLLEEVSLLQATDTLGRAAGNIPEIHLMTLHLAKGLEFDRVFIVGCSEGLLPHERSLADAGQLEEERRLVYVGMTRARKELFLSFYGIPSRFLSEIPPELTRYESVAGEGRAISLEGEERYITLD